MNIEEFRAIRDDAAAVPLAPHGVARLRGDRALEFLHAVTTQDLEGAVPGRGALACVLDEKGRVLAELRVLVLAGGDVLLDGEVAAFEVVTGHLARIAPLSGCEVVDERERWEVLAARGPRAAEAIAALGPLPEDEHAFTVAGDAIVARVEWGVPGFDVLAPRGALPPVDAPRVSPDALEGARIAAGRPRYGVDVTEALLVNETPLLERAVSLTKGCYPGQESVARVRNLGRIRRALVGLDISSPEPPPRGEPVVTGGEEVGRVTSAAAASAGAAAIALVRTEVSPGDEVEVAGARASVRAL